MTKHEERRRRIVSKEELDNLGAGPQHNKWLAREAQESRKRAARERAAKRIR